jgi:hypothetical protein
MSKKSTTIRALFEDVHNLSPEEIAKSDKLKQLLKSIVPECIQQAQSANKQSATLFEINSTDHFVEIPKKDWPQALETCIMWYLESEDYEMCTKLKQLIDEIQKKSTKKLNVKPKSDE